MDTLSQAYQQLFSQPPNPNLKEWEIAKQIIDYSGPNKLEQDLAMKVYHVMVTGIEFPTVPSDTRPGETQLCDTQLRALGLYHEHAEDLGFPVHDELHSAEVAYIEEQRVQIKAS